MLSSQLAIVFSLYIASFVGSFHLFPGHAPTQRTTLSAMHRIPGSIAKIFVTSTSRLHARSKKDIDTESTDDALSKTTAKKRKPSSAVEKFVPLVESDAAVKRSRGRPKTTDPSSTLAASKGKTRISTPSPQEAIKAAVPMAEYPVKESTKKKDEAKLNGVSDDLLYFDLDEDLAKLEADFASEEYDELFRNASAAGGFLFPEGSDDDFDEALRSLESGQFDISSFLEDIETETDPQSEEIAALMPATRPGASAASTKVRSKLDIPEIDDDLIDGASEDSLIVDDEDDIVGVGYEAGEEEDLMLDVLSNDESLEEEEEDVEKIDETEVGRKATSISSRRKAVSPVSNAASKLIPTIPKGAAVVPTGKKKEVEPLVIDGVELDRNEFDLGVEPPPLEEFKRLMESLGSESMFEDDKLFTPESDGGFSPQGYDDTYFEMQELAAAQDVVPELSKEEKLWFPQVYEGGNPSDSRVDGDQDWEQWAVYDDKPATWRVQIVSVITNSTKNTTAADIVSNIYDHIRNATDNDPRINYQVTAYGYSNGESFDELDNNIQMWLEGYNTYHLIDGAAMKEVWGAIMPHIIYSPKNLEAIVEQVKWALAEDELNGTLLSPRMRRIRLRGGAGAMSTGVNTEFLDSEFSVVNVRESPMHPYRGGGMRY